MTKLASDYEKAMNTQEIVRELREIQYAMRLTQQYNRDWQDWHDRIGYMADRLEAAPAQKVEQPVAWRIKYPHTMPALLIVAATEFVTDETRMRKICIEVAEQFGGCAAQPLYAAPVAAVPVSELVAMLKQWCDVGLEGEHCASDLAALIARHGG